MDPTRASKRTRKRPRVRASCQLIAAVSTRINSRRLCLDLCAEPEMFWWRMLLTTTTRRMPVSDPAKLSIQTSRYIISSSIKCFFARVRKTSLCIIVHFKINTVWPMPADTYRHRSDAREESSRARKPSQRSQNMLWRSGNRCFYCECADRTHWLAHNWKWDGTCAQASPFQARKYQRTA